MYGSATVAYYGRVSSAALKLYAKRYQRCGRLLESFRDRGSQECELIWHRCFNLSTGTVGGNMSLLCASRE